MKKTLFLLLVVFLVSGVSQAVAYDYGVSVNDKVVWDGSFVGNGGEFGFSVVGTDVEWSTFCVEYIENLPWGGTEMTVTGISNSNTSATATLTDTVSWLYWNFSQGSLDGYSSNSTNDQSDLQQLIWLELGVIDTASYYDDSQVANWLQWASDDSDWTNDGLVQILNLGGYQDVLVAATDANPNPVPEPASMALLGIGLIGLIVVGRKKVRN